MKKYILLVAIALVSNLLFAQQLKTFTAEESVLLERSLLPERVAQLDWIPGTEKFAYVKQLDSEWQLMSGEAASNKRELLASLADFNTAMTAAGFSAKTQFPSFRLIGPTKFRFMQDHTLCSYDWVSKKVDQLTTYSNDAQNEDLSEQHGIAYTIAQNLYISLPGKPDIAVTNEKNQDIRHGESAHRNEFGITKGTFWSPKGDQIAFYRVDETMVTNYPLFNLHNKPATP